MKSRTSFFNSSLLRKDIVRFAPAWVLYGAYLLLIFGGSVLGGKASAVANDLSGSLPVFGIMNLFYAMLCAQLLFGDLFKSRMCNALHALPIRREGWFITHLLAGLNFSAVPVAAAGLAFLSALGSYWAAGLLWMAVLMLQFLFFFAVAILSVMLVGNRFAAVVVYCILNFLSAIALWLFYSLYAPSLYGFILDENVFLKFCPAAWMVQFQWFFAAGNRAGVELKDGWGYLGVCTIVGVALLAASLVLYRKRPLEKAGDFVVFKPTAPVFLVLYTFSAGTAFHLFSNAFVGESAELIFLVVGLAIGFFTGRMLLERTIRVFRGKTIAGFCTLVAVFGVTILLTIWDPLGVTRWVPEEKDVKWVSVDNYSYLAQDAHAITDPQILREILSVHQHAVENPQEENNGQPDVRVRFTYRLKNGRTVQREYLVDTATVAGVTLEHILSRPELVFGAKYATPQNLVEAIHYIELDKEGLMITDREQLYDLAEALIADALEGNLCQQYTYYKSHGEGNYLYIKKQDSERDGMYDIYGWSICYTEESVHTTAWIKENIK